MKHSTLLAQTASSSAAGAAGIGIVGSLVWLAFVVYSLVTTWLVYTKAGAPGWASIIPVYNVVKLLQITGHSGWWVLGLCVPFLNLFVAIRLIFNLASVFGKGVGFGFGLLFLSPIFMGILAFGDARYVGPY